MLQLFLYLLIPNCSFNYLPDMEIRFSLMIMIDKQIIYFLVKQIAVVDLDGVQGVFRDQIISLPEPKAHGCAYSI